MTRVLSLVVLLTCILLLVGGAAMFERQRIERDRARAADATIEDQLLSLSTALGALSVGQRSNGESDARPYAQVQALSLALRQNTDRDRYRFGVVVSALGAGR